MMTANRKHIFKFTTIVLSILLILSACVREDSAGTKPDEPGQESGPEETGNIQKPDTDRGTIKIASVYFPPFEVIDGENFTGPGYDIIREAFRRMGYSESDYEFVVFPWSRTLEMIKSGDVDIVLDISKTAEREEYINFSSEKFTDYEKHFIVKKSSDIPYDGTIDSLKNYTIGVVRDYKIGPNYQAAKETGQYSFEEASSFEENIDKLLSGRVPIILDTTYAVLDHLAYIDRSKEVKVLKPAFDSTTTYVGFSKILNNIELLEGYDKALQEMRSDGTMQAILDKYFSE